MNIADICTFCQDVKAGRYVEYGITPDRPFVASDRYVEDAMRKLHNGGRRNAAKELGYITAAGLIVPFTVDKNSGVYLPIVEQAAKTLQEYGDKKINRRDLLVVLLAALEFGCGGSGGNSPPPPPPPPPPQQTTVALNIKDRFGNPVTNDNFRFKYGTAEKDTVQNTNGKYSLTFDRTGTAQQSETRTGQPMVGGTTPWYRTTRSEGSILLNDTTLPDIIALMRSTESGNTTLYRHLLNLYTFMTSTDVAPATKLRKYPSLSDSNGVEVNLNHILGVDQYVNAIKTNGLPAWAAGLPQSKKLYNEVTQNPPIGLYFTYANRGLTAPRFNTILKPFGIDSSGNKFVQNFEIEVNTAYNVNQNWLNNLIHELGHALLCLFREDPDALGTHMMAAGGSGRTIQPIEFNERDWQAYLINAHDMGIYLLETS